MNNTSVNNISVNNITAQELSALTDGVPHLIANLANTAALLFEKLEDVNWAGFYILQSDTLVLGPFCGKPACIEIPVGKGVCGAAVKQGRTIAVENVHEFAGHIACDSASNSEIVVPIRKDGKIWGVLDVDSPVTGRFSDKDIAGFEEYGRIIESFVKRG